MDTLRALKLGLRNLHLKRKLYLCSLLALDADGGRSDCSVWTTATESMNNLALETAQMANSIDTILYEEEGRPPLKDPTETWVYLLNKYQPSLCPRRLGSR